MTKAVSHPTPPAPDPLEALGRELVGIIDEHNALDGAEVKKKGLNASDRIQYLNARRAAIETMIATTKAASLAGVLMQACLIGGLVERMIRGGSQADDEQAGLQCKLIGYSIADAIEDIAGMDRDQLFRGNYYTMRKYNPLNPVAACGNGAEPAGLFATLFAEYQALVSAKYPGGNVPKSAGDRCQQIEDLIAVTPSGNMAEARVKAALLAYFESQGTAPHSGRPAGALAAGLVRDLERLAAGGAA